MWFKFSGKNLMFITQFLRFHCLDGFDFVCFFNYDCFSICLYSLQECIDVCMHCMYDALIPHILCNLFVGKMQIVYA